VVHRDLKPENILLGDYGEVYVIDWGIAKLSSESELPIAIDAAHGAAGQTAVGTLLGTPGYMAPEQTCDGSGVDHRADLFSLGAILYEILTGVPAFSGAHLLAIITATRKQQPRRPRELFPACPVVLEDLCLALLDKDPAARPASAKAVADEVQGFLDGAKESERRAEEAGKLIAAARAPVDRYRALAVLREQLAHRAKTLLRDVEPWAPIEHKRAGWTIEDQAREAAAEQARALAAAIELYTKALGYDPAAHAARAGLADLYWEQARQAEVERRTPDQVYYDALVKDYDDGRYAALLAAAGRLSLTTAPVAAEVVAYRYVESDRVLRAVEPVFLGTSPLAEAALPAGSYVLVVAAPGRRTVRYPLVCRRGERERVHIQLYPEAEVGAAFEQVAAGPVTLGGDAAAFDPLPRQAVQVADFALARFPVTWGEYVEFLNFLEARDPAEASRRLPRDETGDGLFVERDRGGRWRPRHELLVEGAGRQFCPPERIAELPVFSVTWFDAVAYCAYRSQRDGLVYELPGEAQWEKAARGADGRFFPWGDHFDATFAKMRESRPGLCQPEPVGSFATDESPYGIRDLAGGMRTWVADIHGELSREAARAEPEPEAGTARDASGLRIARGGAWAVVSQSCRSASRSRLFALNANAAIGLRLARRLG
jgi:serine/threonine-protein kinase